MRLCTSQKQTALSAFVPLTVRSRLGSTGNDSILSIRGIGQESLLDQLDYISVEDRNRGCVLWANLLFDPIYWLRRCTRFPFPWRSNIEDIQWLRYSRAKAVRASIFRSRRLLRAALIDGLPPCLPITKTLRGSEQGLTAGANSASPSTRGTSGRLTMPAKGSSCLEESY